MMMTIANLPNDLETEILARVPAKSLSQLKTTCKRWYTLFKDPKFVEKNKTMSSKSGRESMLLSNHEVYSIAGDLHNSSDGSIEFTGKLSKDLDLYAIYHCDGLMLCQAKDSVVVWNLCTGQRKIIEPRTCRGTDAYALGYSNASSSLPYSYKIMRFGYHLNDQRVLVVGPEIYELSSSDSSWKVLDSSTLYYIMFCGHVSLKGDSYWVAGNITGFFLLKFDFTAERFVCLPLPFQSYGFKDATILLSFVRDEKLAVSHTLFGSDVMRIWITNNKIDDKDLSWRRSDLVLKVDSARYSFSNKNLLLDEEKRVGVCCGKYVDGIRIHICGEDMCKLVYEDTTKGSHLNRPVVITYVPSLFRSH